MVSPNMMYPKMIAAGDQKIYTGLEQKQAGGATLTDKEKAEMAKAKASYEKNKDGTSFIFGLDKPLFGLRESWHRLYSGRIPVRDYLFLALPTEERRRAAFDELYVRQKHRRWHCKSHGALSSRRNFSPRGKAIAFPLFLGYAYYAVTLNPS